MVNQFYFKIISQHNRCLKLLTADSDKGFAYFVTPGLRQVVTLAVPSQSWRVEADNPSFVKIHSLSFWSLLLLCFKQTLCVGELTNNSEASQEPPPALLYEKDEKYRQDVGR